MKSFMYRCRESMVFVVRLFLYAALLFVLLGFLSIFNRQVLTISRTSAIMTVMFIFTSVTMSAIYGKYDVGKRKSKPIIISLTLSTVITDIVTFVMMIIMNTNETTGNRLYPYLGYDILLVLAAMVVQTILIVALTYAGNAVYFHFTKPESCIVITKGAGLVPDFVRGVKQYRKQYRIDRYISFDDPDIREAISAADSVFIDAVPDTKMDELLSYCYGLRKNVYRPMDILGVMTKYSGIVFLDDVPMLGRQSNVITMGQRMIKRGSDIIFSVLGLVIFSPLLLISAIAIKLEDGGSIIFRQNRVTLAGRIFNIYKLRTMRENVEQSMTVAGDKRVTKVGAILRKFRIDELPQFLNVLKGDMSLVGPRAEMLEHVYLYSEKLPEFMYRYRMKAGITGYAQIHGRYNTTPKDKLMMDMTYIESFSIWNDLKLLLQTVLVFFKADDSTAGFSSEDDEKHRRQAREIQKKVRNGNEQ